MTQQITQSNVMSEGQRKQIKRFLQDAFSDKHIDSMLDSLELSKEESQNLLEQGGTVQNDMRLYLIDVLKKYATTGQSFGAALTKFDLVVPDDYDHDRIIDVYSEKVYTHSNNLTSKNFANATNRLQQGKTYRVAIYPMLETVSSQDCLEFLKKKGAILVGAQGLMLIHSLHKDQFSPDTSTVSFDEEEALYRTSLNEHLVPLVTHKADNRPGFYFNRFEDRLSDKACILCVCEK